MAAGHHNRPAAYEHTTVVNSIRPSSDPGIDPASYLLLNGCTNYGGYIFSAVPSDGCSSEATGRAAGMAGLLASAALSAVERGQMTNHLRDDGSEAPFALSAEEMPQLWRLASDDIDFSTPCPEHDLCDRFDELKPASWGGGPTATANNFAFTGTMLPTVRFHTVRGWDYFTRFHVGDGLSWT